ncbi:MAG TPA: lysophospholipid acyltransferase family protein [Xanthobacteraceae bacterium]
MSLVKRLVGSRPFQRAIGVMAAEYLRLVWTTTSFTEEPEGSVNRAKSDFPIIVGMWHGQHFLFPFLRGELPVKVLISRHRDGEINAIAAERLGVGTIRGSGSHGGGSAHKDGVGAFYGMAGALTQGCSVALTADVPKVARRAGPGIVRLAAVSGRPIYVAAIATRNHIMLDNWDHTEINLPFGRGGITARGPMRVAANADEHALEAARQAVEAELNLANARARELAQARRGGGAHG